MKRHLLLLFFVTLFSLGLSAQIGTRGGNQLAQHTTELKMHIYPNPASSYISVSNHKDVDEIVIYNVVGKLIRRFKVEGDRKYKIADLRDGMYLVRFFNDRGKLLSTQRLSKR